jgi:hypothetical protein
MGLRSYAYEFQIPGVDIDKCSAKLIWIDIYININGCNLLFIGQVL